MVSVVAGLLPIVVATVRAALGGWEPIGDNAYFLIRARDVLTEHHPLLGTWTSASQNTDTNFNNPGPLLFDLLAIPAKLGGGIGLAIGVALLNASALVGVAVVARRRGGPLLGAAAMVVTVLLCHSMGSELLFDPWQPHSLLLPFLFGVALVWSVACGDLVALPWALGTASLVVQSHLSYAVLVVALGGWALLGLVLSLRRERRADPEAWPRLRRSVKRTVGVSALVLAVCWIQPAIEMLTAEGQGNLVRLLENSASSEGAVGPVVGSRVVADVITVPPFWLRPSFKDALLADPLAPASAPAAERRMGTVGPSSNQASALLLALVAALAVMTRNAHRRRDHVSVAALGTAGVACLSGLATASSLPLGFFGLPPHQFRWLWPVAAFTTFAVAAFALRRWGVNERWGHPLMPVLTLLTALVAVLNFPAYNVRSGPSHDDWAIEVMAHVRPRMVALEDEGPLLIDTSGTFFNEPYTGPVMAELQRRGIPFQFDDDGLLRQFGSSRRLEGEAQRLLFRQGGSAMVTPAGARRVVLVEGLSDDEQRELRTLRSDLASHLSEQGVVLTTQGETVLARSQYDHISAAMRSGDPERLIDDAVPFLVENNLLVTPHPWVERLERYIDLRSRWSMRTLALFLAPLDPDSGS